MGYFKKKPSPKGLVYLLTWFVLICLGIMNKRMWGHPDQMVFFHLPAAFFLVLACYELSANFRKRNREATRRFQERFLSRRSPQILVDVLKKR